MTKPELVAFIMSKTIDYKKTHLIEKHKAELEALAMAFSAPQGTVSAEHDTQTPVTPSKRADAIIEGVSDNASDLQGRPNGELVVTSGKSAPVEPESSNNGTIEEPAPTAQAVEVTIRPALETENGTPDSLAAAAALLEIVERAYDDNAKMVKGRRMDKAEFRAVAIEAALSRLDAGADPSVVEKTVLDTMTELLTDKIAFCPMNDNERKMLETIPLLPDYSDVESQVNGMGFLQKVKELHNIEISTSRALMVSLKKKKYITIGGGKKTFIVLLDRGVKYLSKVS